MATLLAYLGKEGCGNMVLAERIVKLDDMPVSGHGFVSVLVFLCSGAKFMCFDSTRLRDRRHLRHPGGLGPLPGGLSLFGKEGSECRAGLLRGSWLGRWVTGPSGQDPQRRGLA